MNTMNFLLITPEIVLVVFACAFLIIDSVTKGKYLDILHHLTVLLMICVGVYCLAQATSITTDYSFSNMFVHDALSQSLKGFSALAVAFTLILGANYARDAGIYKGELHVLALFTVVGQMVIMSANSLLMVYLGVELLSLALYAAVAMRRDDVAATEAAMKYFVLGALATGFMLYGMSMIYGSTGSLILTDIAKIASSSDQNNIIFVFGLVFLVAGLAFKLGVVPFHMWVPDVYEGSPSIITLLISGAPKLAAFAMTIRLLVDGLLPLAFDWQQMLMVLAVLSLAIGNLAAIAQTNLKRMLAFSTIAQMGFMLLGMLSGVVDGEPGLINQAYSASMFYTVTYVLTTLGTFGVILVLSSKNKEIINISDLQGLNEKSPWIAFVMLLFMFSLAGIPPMIGFVAKLSVLKALVSAGLSGLAVYAVLMSLIGAFYYIRIVKVMYFEKAVDTQPVNTIGHDSKIILGANGFMVLLLGIVPAPLVAMCSTVILQSISVG